MTSNRLEKLRFGQRRPQLALYKIREYFQIAYNLYVLRCNTIICKEFECLPYDLMTAGSMMQTEILHLSFLMCTVSSEVTGVLDDCMQVL